MFLKSLALHNKATLIRRIDFHKGLNLIVDETSSSNRQASGNNVGKTTVLKLIDYCFGSDGKNIYMDPEFKDRSNTQIENFLRENDICVTMVLKEDLDVELSREITVRHNFLRHKKRIREIDGEQQKQKDFEERLKELVFDTSCKKPKLRQIVAKNIRYEKNRLANALKVLNPYTSKDEYEALFLFWLGIEVDSGARKQQLLREKAIEDRLLSRLRRDATQSQIEQSLIVVNRTIAELEESRNRFTLNVHLRSDLESLERVRVQISETATTIGTMELKRDLILESKVELESETSKVDVAHVRAIYDEACALIPALQKTFEETLDFHNEMVRKKISFITEELPELEAHLAEKKRQLSALLDEENVFAQSLKSAGMIAEMQELAEKLGQLHRQRGTLEEKLRMWCSSLDLILNIEGELSSIDAGIEEHEELIQKRITEFNRHFSQLSATLYGERFVLSSDKGEKGYDLKISSVEGNLGTGMKRGQIAAFDLAYIIFADELNIRCLHFVLQDQIENVHDHQISGLLTDVIWQANCQYILPVLRDKLPPEINVARYQILALSQSEKLFRI